MKTQPDSTGPDLNPDDGSVQNVQHHQTDVHSRAPGAGLRAVAPWAPDAASDLARVVQTCRESVSAEDFELCRLRIRALHDCEPGGDDADSDVISPAQRAALDHWWRSDVFSSRQRALLAFVEQFVFDVSSMSDDHVEALLATDEPVHVHELANTVWVLDLLARVDVVAARVLP